MRRPTPQPCWAAPPVWSARSMPSFVVGALYALVSAYGGLGGTRLLDTIGGSLAQEGKAHDGLLLAAALVLSRPRGSWSPSSAALR
jgi:ABC-type tungstate transport system substrate-binding protein